MCVCVCVCVCVYMYSQVSVFRAKHQLWRPLQCSCRHKGLKFYCRANPLQIFSCEIGQVFHVIIFTEHCQVTASHFLQDFGRTSCHVSKKQPQTLLPV